MTGIGVAMLSKRSLLLIPPLLMGVLLGVGCDGEHGDLREAISQRLAPYQLELDFDIAIPSYLPEGADREGLTYLDEGASFIDDDTGIVFTFNASDDPNIPLGKRPRIEIQEHPAGLDQPPAGSWPLPTPEGVEETLVAGRDVVIHRQLESEDVVVISLSSHSEDILIVVTLDWTNDGPSSRIELTNEMEREAFKVFESMFEGD